MKIENCEMEFDGKLPFDFTDGSCSTFNSFNPFHEPTLLLYLCFGSHKNDDLFGDLFDDYSDDDDNFERACYYINTDFDVFDDRMFEDSENWKVAQSSYSHRNTMGLGNYRGHPFVTGCDSGPDCSTKTEIIEPYRSGLTDYSLQWLEADDYPFVPYDGSVHFFILRMTGEG